ncbi:hypothetical protein RUND412_011548, partial [Rhizina undulata]
GIACIGGYADDYPTGLLTEADEEELQEGLNKNEHYESESDDHHCGPTSLSTIVEHRYQYLRVGKLLPDMEYNTIFRPAFEESRKLPMTVREQYSDHCFIRKIDAGSCATSLHERIIDFLGFGHAVLSRISWSSNDSVAMPYDGGINRGVWARHRFDITTIEALEKDTAGETEWKDVGEEVAKELAAIWKSEYGDNWRESFCENYYYEPEVRYRIPLN